MQMTSDVSVRVSMSSGSGVRCMCATTVHEGRGRSESGCHVSRCEGNPLSYFDEERRMMRLHLIRSFMHGGVHNLPNGCRVRY